MNRSCNSILCRFGIHTADPYFIFRSGVGMVLTAGRAIMKSVSGAASG